MPWEDAETILMSGRKKYMAAIGQVRVRTFAYTRTCKYACRQNAGTLARTSARTHAPFQIDAAFIHNLLCKHWAIDSCITFAADEERPLAKLLKACKEASNLKHKYVDGKCVLFVSTLGSDKKKA